MIQEKEKNLQHKSKHVRIPSSDSEPEKESKQEQLVWAIKDLNGKVEWDVEVGAETIPFTRSLESIPREEGIKHFNFDSFDGLGDPEEHLNYLEQIFNIYYYNDLTNCRFFCFDPERRFPKMVRKNTILEHRLV